MTSQIDQVYLGTSETLQRLKQVHLIDVLVLTFDDASALSVTSRLKWDQNKTSLLSRILGRKYPIQCESCMGSWNKNFMKKYNVSYFNITNNIKKSATFASLQVVI